MRCSWPFLSFLFGCLCLLDLVSSSKSSNSFQYRSLYEPSSTTTVSPNGASRCYKCEDDCNGELGTVEDCHPKSLSFACYTIKVNNKIFQRGCTLDFSEGEDCIQERGNTYCFCRTDECNNQSNKGQSSFPFHNHKQAWMIYFLGIFWTMAIF